MLHVRDADDGVDLVIHLTRDQAAALSLDAGRLADQLDTVLCGLAALRSRQAGGLSLDLSSALLVAEASLSERLRGVRDAATRALVTGGGSVTDLAAATDLPRATAQARRERVLRTGPTHWETWAATTPAARA